MLFPVLLLSIAYLARALLAGSVPLAVFKVAIPVLLALVAIRMGAKILQVPLTTRLGYGWWNGRFRGWRGWPWCSGSAVCCGATEELDQITWKVGGTALSVRTIIEWLVDGGRGVAGDVVDFRGH